MLNGMKAHSLRCFGYAGFLALPYPLFKLTPAFFGFIYIVQNGMLLLTFHFIYKIVAFYTNEKKAFWYGAHFSFQQLVNKIEQIDNSLTEPLTLECLVGKATLTNAKNGHYKIPKRKYLKININEWTLERMIPTAINSDLIILPSSENDPRRRLASPNRLLTGFSFCRPVIATNILSYSDFYNNFIDFDSVKAKEFFKNYYYNEAVIENAKNISIKYQPDNISNIWSNAFKEILS
jgi:hypothetical protein